jgi:hypothetical protein
LKAREQNQAFLTKETCLFKLLLGWHLKKEKRKKKVDYYLILRNCFSIFLQHRKNNFVYSHLRAA